MTQIIVQETSYTIEVTEANNTLIVNTAPVTVTVTSPGPQGAAGPGGSIDDEAYGAGWDGVTDEGASKNALYDKIETLQPLDADLTALAGLSSTGIMVRTGTGTATTRLINSGLGISITNGTGVSGNITVAATDDLLAVENLASQGYAVRTGGSSWALRTFNAQTGINILEPAGTTVSTTIGPANDLLAVESLATTGLAVRTGTETWATRTIYGSGGITVTNGNGTVGDITINPPQALSTADSPSFVAVTVNDDAYDSGWNGDLTVPTKNAIFDSLMPKSGGTFTGAIGVPVTGGGYGPGWNGSNEVPSKDDVFDAIQSVTDTSIRVITDAGGVTSYTPSADTDAARGTALSTAVSAMASGDALLFGPGTYEISATLTPPASSRMQGIGNPLIYAPSLAADTPAITLSASNTTLDSFRIQANVTCAGIHTATPATISGIVLRNLYCTVTDTDANAIMFTQNSGGGAAEHNVSFDAYDCVFTGGTVSGFGVHCCLSDGDINLYNCNVYGATDGILNRTHTGTGTGVTNIYGGKYESVLDAITSGGGTGNVINVYGAYAYGVQADLYGDDGAINHYWGHFRPDYAVGNGLQIGTNPILGHIVPYQNDGGQLGTSSYAWSDLFLASGSVVNWAAGDITVTHSTNVLTWDGGGMVFNEAGADFDYRFEADSDANNLVIDGGTTGFVGIGTASQVSAEKLSISKSGNTAFNDCFTVMAPSNTTAGNRACFNVGVANSANNLATFAFRYAGSGSTSNAFDVFFHSSANPAASFFAAGNGGIGLGSSGTASAFWHVIGTTEQLRLGYNSTNYLSTTLDSGANCTFNLTASAGTPEFTFSDAVNVPDEAYGSGWNGNTEVPTKNAVYDRLETMKIESFIIAIGDETTAITTGTAKVTFRMPYAFTLTEVRGSLTTASSSGSVVIDINDSGTTIMTTDKITIEASETTSKDATTQPAITDASLADNAVITIDIDSAGTGATGAKVYLIGYKT